jgi:hypothetical protein
LLKESEAAGNQSAFLSRLSRFLIKVIEALILMKDFAIKPPQTLNCRHEKPVDGSSPNRSLDPTSPTFIEVHSVMTAQWKPNT